MTKKDEILKVLGDEGLVSAYIEEYQSMGFRFLISGTINSLGMYIDSSDMSTRRSDVVIPGQYVTIVPLQNAIVVITNTMYWSEDHDCYLFHAETAEYPSSLRGVNDIIKRLQEKRKLAQAALEKLHDDLLKTKTRIQSLGDTQSISYRTAASEPALFDDNDVEIIKSAIAKGDQRHLLIKKNVSYVINLDLLRAASPIAITPYNLMLCCIPPL